MKIIEEKIVVEQVVKTYIAIDGQEFPTEQECLKHEAELEKEAIIKRVEKMVVPELDELVPLTSEETMENHTYRWYRVTSEDDFELLSEAFLASAKAPDTYPMFVCLEFYDAPFSGEAYYYFLDDCAKDTKKFWSNFNVNFEFNGKKESDVSGFYVKGVDAMEGQTFAKCTSIEKAKHAIELLEEKGIASKLEVVREHLEEDILQLGSEKITL